MSFFHLEVRIKAAKAASSLIGVLGLVFMLFLFTEDGIKMSERVLWLFVRASRFGTNTPDTPDSKDHAPNSKHPKTAARTGLSLAEF